MNFLEACKRNDINTVRSMLENSYINETIVDVSTFKKNALHISSEYGHSEIVKLLLNSGSEDYTPLMYACVKGHVSIVKILLKDPRTDINAVDKYNFNCLVHCCSFNHCELAEIILINPKFDKCNDISIRESYYSAYLHGCEEILKLLIVLIDDIEFRLSWDSIVEPIITFKSSTEYYNMRCKYLNFKDYYAGCIFYNIVMISDDYLKIK